MNKELLFYFLNILNFHNDFKGLALEERQNITRKFQSETEEQLERFGIRTNEKTTPDEKFHAYIKDCIKNKNIEELSAAACSANDSSVTPQGDPPATTPQTVMDRFLQLANQLFSAPACSANDSSVTPQRDPAAMTPQTVMDRFLQLANQLPSDFQEKYKPCKKRSFKGALEEKKMEEILREAQGIMNEEDLEKLRQTLFSLQEGPTCKAVHPNYKNNMGACNGRR